MRHFSANKKGSTARLLCEIPKRIAVFGSKPWDLEAAQSFYMIGSEVTLIESGPLPNSVGLGLRELGVKLALSQVEGMEQGAVLVNERMETSVPHIYAVSDVTAGPIWSHKANVEGIIAGENAMGLTSKKEA
jgi:pyruvate/2-oxoglutarate dehydrogenase complex dihydrolipoamide dehydrogenase (E3) component